LRRRREVGGVVLTTVLLAMAMVAAAVVQGMRNNASPGGDGAANRATRTQETWLVVSTVEADPSGRADWLAVMSRDPQAGRSLVLYIPRSTLAELPGYGMDTLAAAQAIGKEPLLQAAVSNLIGLRFDHVLRVSDQAEHALFDKLGPVTIDVERDLDRPGANGGSEVVFAAGTQKLSGARAAEWLGYSDSSGDEISRSVRHSTFWSALFGRYAGDRAAAFGKVMAGSKDLVSTDASAADLERFFGELASADVDKLLFDTLPVAATGVDTGTELYAIDRRSTDDIVERYLAGSRPPGSGAEGRLVQILNGSGVPGIGQSVADRLMPKGFRIVLNQNAKRFDYDQTQIVVYADTAKARALGDEVRAALGVGQVIVSRQSQGLVDVTIVVGQDFTPPDPAVEPAA
jgi:polyisoprenyl-teichoic acid--peptidoglycan teichoic acid transferase